MNEFCQNCGSPLESGSTFCANCGANNAAQPAAKQSLNPKMLLIGAVAVVVVVALIIGIVSIAGGGYKKAVDNMMNVSFKGKASAIEKLAPKAFWEYAEEQLDEMDVKFDMEKLVEEYEDHWDDRLDDLQDEYGDDFKASYKIEYKEKLEDKEIKKINKALEEDYDFDDNSVKAGYRLEVDMTIKGEEERESDETAITVVKIGGKWYPISAYESTDEDGKDAYKVSFMAYQYLSYLVDNAD